MALVQGDDGNNNLFGFASDDLIEGFGGNDYLVGLGGADALYGDAGNDTLSGGAGDDDLFGGSGLDWARFQGNISEYRVTSFSDHVNVNDVTFDGGLDYVGADVERIQFDDLGIAYDLYGNAGAAARLIGTLFGGEVLYSEPVYMQIILDAFDDGYTAEQIAAAAIDIVYPTYTDEQLADLIYYNLAGYYGSQGEIDAIESLIYDYGDAYITVAAGYTSYNDVNIDFAGLVANGVDFLPLI
ncbi:MAG: hypothetical protein V4669_19180 [Pseudomonadota bacterium]